MNTTAPTIEYTYYAAMTPAERDAERAATTADLQVALDLVDAAQTAITTATNSTARGRAVRARSEAREQVTACRDELDALDDVEAALAAEATR